jgi:hypothetical protein
VAVKTVGAVLPLSKDMFILLPRLSDFCAKCLKKPIPLLRDDILTYLSVQ